MNKNKKSSLMINCQEATLLIEKKQEKQITILERIKLLLHLILCELCRRYQKQSQLISKAARQNTANQNLSAEEKENLRKIIKQEKK